MELRHLRAFVAVAEERHFGRAADRLHMAQPPLSQQIRRLEAELGVELLHRTTRRVELAPAGEVLLDRARSILADADAAAEDARRAAGGEVGRLAIGFTGSATYALLPSLATALRDRLPGVELELRGELLTPAQVSGLHDETLDIALLRPPVRDRALALEVVRSEPLVAVLPERHPLAALDAVPVARLATEPFVSYPSHFRSTLHDAVEDACAAHGFAPIVALEVSETATLVSFVAAGIGVSLVPESVMRLTVAGAIYRPLADEPARVELALAHRRGDESPVLARALEIVRTTLK
ncbi:LysR family transcriptional regulator [Solirubrobacter soli]|uniref:LysR family transcriptional regulator n=1 Tax=Solirubrobacter soli TaxID=363832 RepID=UPI0004146776|nr:LysR family transcriptional regulator [Solirubrobacter soli]